MRTILTLFLFVIIKSIAFAQVIDSLIDNRDGKVYKTVKIGTQIWMAENLNFATDTGSICYDNKLSNCKIYGRLYTWEMAKSVCPKGWHLPSEDEWQKLERYLGMTEDDIKNGGYRGESANIGGKLKSKLGWPENEKIVYENIGFNALPGGNYGFHEKEFGLLLNNALFWTSTSFNDNFAYGRDLDTKDNMIFRLTKYKRLGFSVRCVKDE